MNKLFLIIGVLVFALGLVWIGQGLGYIHTPTSFMINEKKWAYYGGGVALVGLIIIWFSRR